MVSTRIATFEPGLSASSDGGCCLLAMVCMPERGEEPGNLAPVVWSGTGPLAQVLTY